MTYIFKFNTKSDIIQKTSSEHYIPDKKQNLIINDSLYNTSYNNISDNLCKTNIKNYIYYNANGKQSYTEFEIYIYHNDTLNYLLLKSMNDTYLEPSVKYNLNLITSNGIFSNIKSVSYEFNSKGDYTFTYINN